MPEFPEAAAMPQAGASSSRAYQFAPPVLQTRLDNGLDVVVLPDTRSEAVTHMVWYKNGSVDDPMGKSGVAHFLEHLMFKGTPNVSAEAFRKTVARAGGMFNAFTGPSVTCYFEQVTRDILPKCMGFEADRMQNLVFDAAVSAAEREVILAERGQMVEADPGRLLDEGMFAAAFGDAPEGRPVIGWRPEIERLTHEDAQAYYQRFYTPSNAVLLIVGDVDMDEARDLALAHYGKIPGRATVPRERSHFAAMPQDPIVVHHSSVRIPEVRRMFRVPSPLIDAKIARALDLIDFYLDGTATAVLRRVLTADRKVASSVGVSYFADVFPGETLLRISASVAEGVSVERLEDELDALLGKIASDGVPEDALNRCKRHYEARSMFSIDNQESLAQFVGSKLAMGHTLASTIGWQTSLYDVTFEDTVRAAALLAPARALRGRLLQGASMTSMASA